MRCLDEKLISEIDSISEQYYCSILEETKRHGSCIRGENVVFLKSFPSIILFLANYALYKGVSNSEIDDLLYRYCKMLVDNINSTGRLPLSLTYGLTGIGSSVRSASRIIDGLGAIREQIDRLICLLVGRQINGQMTRICSGTVNYGDYDVIQGLSSTLMYLLDEPNTLEISASIQSIKRFLLIGFNNRDNMGLSLKVSAGSGKFVTDLGVAHGLAGPLIALANSSKKIESDLELRQIKNALQSGSDFYLKNFRGLRDGPVGCWPAKLLIQKRNKLTMTKNDRLSWCYGTIGILFSLLQVNLVLNNSRLSSVCNCVYSAICDMDQKAMNLVTPTFCHGYAGVLTILSRIGEESGDVPAALGQDKLVRKIISFRNHHYPYCFFDIDMFHDGVRYKRLEQFCDLGLLNGASGTILSLMSSNNDQVAQWSKIFMI